MATARLNGHNVINEDVKQLRPEDLSSGLGLFVQASPPCQGLSTAGKKTGRTDLENLVLALRGHSVTYNDDRSELMLEIMRWTHAADYIMLEQVPAAIGVWQEIEKQLQPLGFNTWSGVVRSEEFGVPQSRRRAILLASRYELKELVSTHSKFYTREPTRIDAGKEKWLSVSNVLDIDEEVYLGFPRRADKHASVTIGGIEYRARDLRQCKYPAFALTEKARSWTYNGKQLTANQAGTLMTFNQYQWAGSRTRQFLQIANALPPTLAVSLIECLNFK